MGWFISVSYLPCHKSAHQPDCMHSLISTNDIFFVLEADSKTSETHFLKKGQLLNIISSFFFNFTANNAENSHEAPSYIFCISEKLNSSIVNYGVWYKRCKFILNTEIIPYKKFWYRIFSLRKSTDLSILCNRCTTLVCPPYILLRTSLTAKSVG